MNKIKLPLFILFVGVFFLVNEYWAEAGVIGNIKTNLYYSEDYDKLPLAEFQDYIENEDMAFKKGYKKSPLCYLEGEHLMEVRLSAYWDEFLRGSIGIYSSQSEDPIIQRVKDVASKIVPVVTRNYVPIKLYVLNSHTGYSFMVLGGGIVLTDSLVQICENDDELAALVAHEIAHFDREDLNREIGDLKGMDLFMKVAMDTKYTYEDLNKILDATLLVAENGYSQKVEFEADKLAMVYMSQAGFNPEAYLSIHDKINTSDTPCTKSFSSGFPSMDGKIEALAEFLPALRHKGETPSGGITVSYEYTTDAESLRSRALEALHDNGVRLRVFECVAESLPYRGLYVVVEDLFHSFQNEAKQKQLEEALRKGYFNVYPHFSYVVIEVTDNWNKEGFWKTSFALD
ncbi:MULTISPECIES: M48 family metalloprotease [Aminobacterium]|jgi:Zn-dependent protease with chaperone function|uniref:M48 family metalloprotease n=1 Tax=Aminobacterium TaxID=81466 RepID=UPI00257EAEF1|nr:MULTISPECIES: M48 family metalloprotease [unclassified Aminobacterium]